MNKGDRERDSEETEEGMDGDGERRQREGGMEMVGRQREE